MLLLFFLRSSTNIHPPRVYTSTLVEALVDRQTENILSFIVASLWIHRVLQVLPYHDI